MPRHYQAGTAPAISAPSPGFPTQPQMAAPQTAQPGPRDMRSLLIALIAAATTLIALALTALVILKLVDKPADAPIEAAPPAPIVKPAPKPTPVPVPAPLEDPVVAQKPAADPPRPVEKPVGVGDLPQEKPKPVAQKPSGTSPTPAPKPQAGTSVPAPPTAGEKGFLTIACDPACDSVSAGGRNFGPSPVVRAPLPPGNHTVTLRKAGSPTKSLGVTIVSGQNTARRVKMTE
jgi:hypothetical protein